MSSYVAILRDAPYVAMALFCSASISFCCAAVNVSGASI